MGQIHSDTKVYVVQGAPWMDAVIKLLQPRSPYRPWRGALGARPDDAIVAILDTDPPSVIAEVRTVGPGERVDDCLAGAVDPDRASGHLPALLDLGTLTALAGLTIRLDGIDATVPDAARLLEMLTGRVRPRNDLSYLHGHTSLAAARILLESRGRCTGCDRELRLARDDARYHLHIHTVEFDPAYPRIPVAYDPPREEPPIVKEYSAAAIRLGDGRWRPQAIPPDWPAVLCDPCHDRMRHERFTTFLEFRFSLHPRCPSCSARWTMRTTAGFVAACPQEPWIHHTGCSPEQKWCCGACGHGFGGVYRPWLE